jgi:hypothetical protein
MAWPSSSPLSLASTRPISGTCGAPIYYMEEAGDDLKRELGFEEGSRAAVADTLAHLDQFAPPAQRLVLAEEDGMILGCGCL